MYPGRPAIIWANRRRLTHETRPFPPPRKTQRIGWHDPERATKVIPQNPTPNKNAHIAASGLGEFLCDVDLCLRGWERRRTGLTMTPQLQRRSRRGMEGTTTESAVQLDPVYRDRSPLSKTHHDPINGRGNCGWEKEWTSGVTGCVSVLRG